ncbi:MAG: pilin [Elusimicrobiaceae bacterium]|nr:pilin [Elusimicrobiaceae bacterium]
MSKKAFTLIELLIVVLIIGILSAIAIPMYQGAVDKSHWSTMLPGAKAIKDAEEAFKMSNDGYTDTMANLDVTMENSDLIFNLITPNNTSEPNVIRVTNSKLANVRLASYLDQSPMFAGQLHCEAKTGDERAERLCGKLLMGQELTSSDGYTAYLLDQEIDKATCDNASRSWSTSKTKCYRTTTDRCEALGMPVLASEGDVCGYTNTSSSNLTIKEGMCIATGNNGCSHITFDGNESSCETRDSFDNCRYGNFKNGAQCTATAQWGCMDSHYASESTCTANGPDGCRNSTFSSGAVCEANISTTCYGSTFNEGASCKANQTQGCGRSTFKAGSKCIANAPNTCCVNGCNWYGSVTYDGGCCEGPYCPSNAPKC